MYSDKETFVERIATTIGAVLGFVVDGSAGDGAVGDSPRSHVMAASLTFLIHFLFLFFSSSSHQKYLGFIENATNSRLQYLMLAMQWQGKLILFILFYFSFVMMNTKKNSAIQTTSQLDSRV